MIKTQFNVIDNDWKRVKNHCRVTDNKDFTDKEPTETFKKKLLISEHTPIRLLQYDWTWIDMPYWVQGELSRHKFEKFISTQRDDRLMDDIPRGKKPQDAPVRFDGFANHQNIIDAWRKRLCFMATKEARSYAVSFKFDLEEAGYKDEANTFVPNCIYRCGCPEFTPCGFWAGFVARCKRDGVDIFDIQQRYDKYTEVLHEMEGR